MYGSVDGHCPGREMAGNPTGRIDSRSWFKCCNTACVLEGPVHTCVSRNLDQLLTINADDKSGKTHNSPSRPKTTGYALYKLTQLTHKPNPYYAFALLTNFNCPLFHLLHASKTILQWLSIAADISKTVELPDMRSCYEGAR